MRESVPAQPALPRAALSEVRLEGRKMPLFSQLALLVPPSAAGHEERAAEARAGTGERDKGRKGRKEDGGGWRRRGGG